MSSFGDEDPEDAWDDGDPLALRLILLGRIMVDIFERAERGDLERSTVRRAELRRPVRRLLAELDDELGLGLVLDDGGG